MPDSERPENRRGSWQDERLSLGERLLKSPQELLECLTRQPFTLRDRVGLTVRWGVAMNLVRFDEGSGLAYARQGLEQVDPTIWNNFKADLGVDDPDELEFHFRSSAPFFTSDAEMRAYNDLCYALETGYGQSVALAASQRAATQRAGTLRVYDRSEEANYSGMKQLRASDTAVDLARYLLPRVAIIAEEDTSADVGPVPKTRMIPKRVYDDFIPILELLMHREQGTKEPLWFYYLQDAFQKPLLGSTAREAVGWLLFQLREGGGPIPDPFNDPTPHHVVRAIGFIRSLNIESPVADSDGSVCSEWRLKHSYTPARRQRGRPMNAWKAAVDFASCFGVSGVTAREQDAKRRK